MTEKETKYSTSKGKLTEKEAKYSTSEEQQQTDNEDLSPLDDSLYSMEKFDRTSPELWPEQIPGVTEFVSTHCSTSSTSTTVPVWLEPLSAEDVDLMHKLATHTTAGLISEVKNLHDLTYQLGLEESREMTRGKYLNIFPSKKPRL